LYRNFKAIGACENVKLTTTAFSVIHKLTLHMHKVYWEW